MNSISVDRREAILGGLALLSVSGTARAAGFEPNVLAQAFADLAQREYHDAAMGDALARRVESKIAAGAYTTLHDARRLAATLMDDATVVTADKHFYVLTGMHHGAAPSIRPGKRKARPDAERLEQISREEFGVRSALQDGVGVITIAQFYAPYAEVREAYGAAFHKAKDARALVFDLTSNIGGDPACVAYASSYLFERAPFVINRFYWRASGVEEFRTTRDLAGPVFPEERPVFVATSKQTFSAGEEFAYNLQALKRAVIVGEQTAGGANHAEMFMVGGDIVAFIPCARAENPVTGANWEGVGVKPDVRTTAADALSTALRLARAV